jgi:hypothetical protein
MDCGIDTIETQDETGATRGIEIIPKGCRPVSESECLSGYMAPPVNVTFPKNALKQCCKCKTGENCPFCANPAVCTTEEKKEFVADENCFGYATGPSPGPSLGPSPGPSPGPSLDPSPEKPSVNYYLIGGGFVILILILIIVLISRRPKST